MKPLFSSIMVVLVLVLALMPSAQTMAGSDEPGVSQPGSADESQLPIYSPPKKFVPRARVGGELRGKPSTLISFDGDEVIIERK